MEKERQIAELEKSRLKGEISEEEYTRRWKELISSTKTQTSVSSQPSRMVIIEPLEEKGEKKAFVETSSGWKEVPQEINKAISEAQIPSGAKDIQFELSGDTLKYSYSIQTPQKLGKISLEELSPEEKRLVFETAIKELHKKNLLDRGFEIYGLERTAEGINFKIYVHPTEEELKIKQASETIQAKLGHALGLSKFGGLLTAAEIVEASARYAFGEKESFSRLAEKWQQEREALITQFAREPIKASAIHIGIPVAMAGLAGIGAFASSIPAIKTITPYVKVGTATIGIMEGVRRINEDVLSIQANEVGSYARTGFDIALLGSSMLLFKSGWSDALREYSTYAKIGERYLAASGYDVKEFSVEEKIMAGKAYEQAMREFFLQRPQLYSELQNVLRTHPELISSYKTKILSSDILKLNEKYFLGIQKGLIEAESRFLKLPIEEYPPRLHVFKFDKTYFISESGYIKADLYPSALKDVYYFSSKSLGYSISDQTSLIVSGGKLSGSSKWLKDFRAEFSSIGLSKEFFSTEDLKAGIYVFKSRGITGTESFVSKDFGFYTARRILTLPEGTIEVSPSLKIKVESGTVYSYKSIGLTGWKASQASISYGTQTVWEDISKSAFYSQSGTQLKTQSTFLGLEKSLGNIISRQIASSISSQVKVPEAKIYYMPETKTASAPTLAIRTDIKTESMQKTKQNLETYQTNVQKTFEPQVIKYGGEIKIEQPVKQIQKQMQSQIQIQSLFQSQLQLQSLKQTTIGAKAPIAPPTTKITKISVPSWPKISFPKSPSITFPPFAFISSFRPSFKISTKSFAANIRPQYKPSLVGIMYGIKRSFRKILTGFEIRGI